MCVLNLFSDFTFIKIKIKLSIPLSMTFIMNTSIEDFMSELFCDDANALFANMARHAQELKCHSEICLQMSDFHCRNKMNVWNRQTDD